MRRDGKEAEDTAMLEIKQSPVAIRKLQDTAHILGPLLQDEEMNAIMAVFARAAIRISTAIGESEVTPT